VIVWNAKRLSGGEEYTLVSKVLLFFFFFKKIYSLKLTLDHAPTNNVRKEIGPISMNFEIPMWNGTGVRLVYAITIDFSFLINLLLILFIVGFIFIHSKCSTLDIAERGGGKKHFKWLRCKTFVSSYVRRLA